MHALMQLSSFPSRDSLKWLQWEHPIFNDCALCNFLYLVHKRGDTKACLALTHSSFIHNHNYGPVTAELLKLFLPSPDQRHPKQVVRMRAGVLCCLVLTTYVTTWLFFSASRALHCCDPICHCGKVCCQGIPLVNHWIKCLQLWHDLPSKPLDKTQNMAKQHSCNKHTQSKKLINSLHQYREFNENKSSTYYVDNFINISFLSIGHCCRNVVGLGY